MQAARASGRACGVPGSGPYQRPGAVSCRCFRASAHAHHAKPRQPPCHHKPYGPVSGLALTPAPAFSPFSSTPLPQPQPRIQPQERSWAAPTGICSSSVGVQIIRVLPPALDPEPLVPTPATGPQLAQQQQHHHHQQHMAAPTPEVDGKREVAVGVEGDGSGGAGSGQWAGLVRCWSLLLLSLAYIHQAGTAFSIPAMLPMISSDLQLDDMQGALLTTGYSYLYALALVPMGILADRLHRPQLLGLSLAAWSALSLLASDATSFGQLMLGRVGLAAAQSSQNVISFAMIPDLFPQHRSTALAVYNSSIYIGRGLIYVAIAALQHHLALQPGSIDAASQALIIRDIGGNM
ncbi:hypothetical protein QJQ45_024620 [Haematococcus lacustris]|nr:hypothetical protein QJQ45_024620 [Haematococcus lacustris]